MSIVVINGLEVKFKNNPSVEQVDMIKTMIKKGEWCGVMNGGWWIVCIESRE